ncbi:Anthranilate synthase [Thermodesulfobium narugense DSM 14796]|uniref:Anthranilate synthase component 1 n=1 Tax=Thermodesulfobium narugense DSM 14796 TaxID=747365 RepID=M1E9K6_9BACT|nr:anthranilate synthase component I [Thermodesulfobium narugense]AEE15444.1 Anthranilate synthase [Thermodesulfobium narugense DSM 14796]
MSKLLVRSYCADSQTPISLYEKLKNLPYSFLLESKTFNKLSRYSFLGTFPRFIISTDTKSTRIIADMDLENIGIRNTNTTDSFIDVLKNIFRKLPKVDTICPFSSGIVGYIGYECVRFYEKSLRFDKPAIFPDAMLFFPGLIIAFDHFTDTIYLMSHALYKSDEKRAEFFINEGEKFIQSTNNLNSTSKNLLSNQNLIYDEVKDNNSIINHIKRIDFENAVKKVKEYIRNGDTFQTVLSQRLSSNFFGDPYEFYRNLRRLNPSPYLFHIKLNDIVISGSSPETFLTLRDGKLFSRPIAGTRKRGKDPLEDKRLAKELLSDPKECAEHVMLVDLARNDLGRVCVPSSVKVEDFMKVENYSHVMHIVSEVTGILDKSVNPLEAFFASFPAGTVSGAPKIRAIEIIDSIETERRGPYAGAVGYFDISSNFDTCIAIRTAFFKDNKIYLQAGAGIVADSDPSSEYLETIHKAKALLSIVNRGNKL